MCQSHLERAGMQSEFYGDLQKRMYTIALFGQLFSLLRQRGRTLDSYGFSRLDEQVLLFFMVLRYIMERTLASEPCFLEEVALCILEGNRELFHKELDLEQCSRLADLIVSGILCNQGAPFSFDPIEGDDRWKVRLNYLNSEVVYDGPTPKASYKMSDDGFHLMLSTLEMEENLRLQFRDLVFELQMKAKNYPKALDEIREIFQLLKIQEVEIQNKSLQVRSNAAILDQKAYVELNRSTYTLISESHTKFQGYWNNVNSLLQELQRALAAGTFSAKDEADLASLSAISSYLSKSILAQVKILEAITQFSRLLDEQLEFQMRQSFYERRPFRQVVWQKIMDEPGSLENFDELLHPLFFKAPAKQFSPIRAFEYKQLRQNELDGTSEEVDQDYDQLEYERQRQENIRRVQAMNEKVQTLLMRLANVPGHTLPLDDVFEREEFETLDQAREMLSSLSSITSFDLADLYSKRHEIIIEEQTSFSLPLAILEAMENELELQDYLQLNVQKTDHKMEFAMEEEGMEALVRVDGLQLSLERKPL